LSKSICDGVNDSGVGCRLGGWMKGVLPFAAFMWEG